MFLIIGERSSFFKPPLASQVFYILTRFARSRGGADKFFNGCFPGRSGTDSGATAIASRVIETGIEGFYAEGDSTVLD
jgi:hypothetical protein